MNLRGLTTFVKRYNWSHAIAVGGAFGAGKIPAQEGYGVALSVAVAVIVILLIGVMSPPSTSVEE